MISAFYVDRGIAESRAAPAPLKHFDENKGDPLDFLDTPINKLNGLTFSKISEYTLLALRKLDGQKQSVNLSSAQKEGIINRVQFINRKIEELNNTTFNKVMHFFFNWCGWNNIELINLSNFSDLFPSFKTFDAVELAKNDKLEIVDQNKQCAYDHLVNEKSKSKLGNNICVRKYSLTDVETLKSQPLSTLSETQVTVKGGVFEYPASTDKEMHWTANFADSTLFGHCEGHLLAQDELQVLEHPALYHVKKNLPEGMEKLNGENYEAALFQNVPRLGRLNTRPEPNVSLYGEGFRRASHGRIKSALTPFENPIESNIFAIAAPFVPELAGQLYRKEHLERLFYTAYNAFSNIKNIAQEQGKKAIVHTGNWGAGAFGNDPKTVYLIQLLAAQFAGIDEIVMYPIEHSNFQQFGQAQLAFEQFEGCATVEDLLTAMAANAEKLNLRYGRGNGT